MSAPRIIDEPLMTSPDQAVGHGVWRSALGPVATKAQKHHMLQRGLALLVGAVLLGVLPLFLLPYQQNLAIEIFAFALFAMSLDLIYGYAGMVSLGHALFFGVGGYSVGLLAVRYGISSFWVGTGIAVVLAAASAAVVAFVALRTRGIYFVLVTFAMGEMLYSLANHWQFFFTNGAQAVVGIVPPNIEPFAVQWTTRNLYYFTLIVVALAGGLLYALTRSRFGQILQGIRENEGRMGALGYNTWLYKYVAFVISGAVAGLAGVLFVYNSGIIAPSNVDVTQSGLVVLMLIIGGTGRLWGGVIGATVVTIVQFVAGQDFPSHVDMVLGLLFLAAFLLMRGVAWWRARAGGHAGASGGAHAGD